MQTVAVAVAGSCVLPEPATEVGAGSEIPKTPPTLAPVGHDLEAALGVTPGTLGEAVVELATLVLPQAVSTPNTARPIAMHKNLPAWDTVGGDRTPQRRAY